MKHCGKYVNNLQLHHSTTYNLTVWITRPHISASFVTTILRIPFGIDTFL